MKKTCCALLAVFCLSGCADPLGLFGEAEPAEVLLAVPEPAPAAPDYNFCRRIAAQDAAKDNPTRDTQARRQEASFRDCAAAFGDA
ncbi:hypothetical protein AYO42_02455 [Rhizomicrobium sp. SCGC AG-212-E05]|nr:hypothetical protein AYO42_02455 [Rhizomicrobium sp. SCGC AG-212-E05]